MLADKDVDGGVLERRYASRFGEDVDTGQRAPGDLEAVARLLFDGSGVGPVLKVAEYLGVVLGHLNGLLLGFLKVAVERRAKEAGGITE